MELSIAKDDETIRVPLEFIYSLHDDHTNQQVVKKSVTHSRLVMTDPL